MLPVPAGMAVGSPELPEYCASPPEPEQAVKKLVNTMHIAKKQSEAETVDFC
jgi:hypothetical protein